MKYSQAIKTFFKRFLLVTRLNDPRPALFLFWPCAWGVLLATDQIDHKTGFILGLFALACLCMYVVGCITNDIIDRDLDAMIPRTANRLIASRQYNIFGALLIATFFGFMALRVLLLFNKNTIVIGCFGVVLAMVYPFMKRVTHYVQLFLGATAGIGVLVGYSAIKNGLSMASLLIYIGSVYWTGIYDTMYGYQDKEYDKKLGIKSLALLYGNKLQMRLKVHVVMIAFCFLLAGLVEDVRMNAGYFMFVLFAVFFLWRSVKETDLEDPKSCYGALVANTLIGGLITLGCYIGRLALN